MAEWGDGEGGSPASAARRPAHTGHVGRVVAAACAALWALSGCTGAGGSVPVPSATVSSPPAATGTSHAVDKIVVVVLENHSLDQALVEMPYVAGLTDRFGYASAYQAITHPSLPNYLAIAGGSTFGVVDDGAPGDHPLTGPSIFGATIAAGGTARVYADAMTENCGLANTGTYAVRHNPWTYFVDERSLCERYDVPFDAFSADVAAGDLPNLSLVVPDVCHDGHDCGLATADAWFATVLDEVLRGPDYRSGRLLVVVTTDEDDKGHDNRVLTVVIHPSRAGADVVTADLDHFALSRLCSEVTGTAPVGRAADAASMAHAFGLDLG